MSLVIAILQWGVDRTLNGQYRPYLSDRWSAQLWYREPRHLLIDSCNWIVTRATQLLAHGHYLVCLVPTHLSELFQHPDMLPVFTLAFRVGPTSSDHVGFLARKLPELLWTRLNIQLHNYESYIVIILIHSCASEITRRGIWLPSFCTVNRYTCSKDIWLLKLFRWKLLFPLSLLVMLSLSFQPYH